MPEVVPGQTTDDKPEKRIDPPLSEKVPVQTTDNMPEKRINPTLSEVVPGIFIGDWRSSYNLKLFEEHQIKSVLSVGDSPSVHWHQPKYIAVITDGRHLKIPCLDSSHQDILIHLGRACEFIETSLALGGVLVHCSQGISRSTSFVVAYLMRKDRRSRDEVLVDIKLKRKVRPSANFMTQLDLWGQMDYKVWEDDQEKVPKAPYAKLVEEKGLTAVFKSAGEIAFGL